MTGHTNKPWLDVDHLANAQHAEAREKESGEATVGAGRPVEVRDLNKQERNQRKETTMDTRGIATLEGREPTASTRESTPGEQLGEWMTTDGVITATFSYGLGLAIWFDGQLVGCHMHTARAMALVNRLAGQTVWSE